MNRKNQSPLKTPRSAGISFTALFTGHVWYENKMSQAFFTSNKARLLYQAMQPFEWASGEAFGLKIEDILLQRHKIMDHRIEQLIADHGVTQILEIACGYSPRGYTLVRKYPELRYVEADLPHMARAKRALVERNKGFGENHQVVACDVFQRTGPDSLDAVMSDVLSGDRPTIVLTEGLVNYFKLRQIRSVWERIAHLQRRFPRAWYLTDLVMQPRPFALKQALRISTSVLSVATRAKVNLHYHSDRQIKTGFFDCGFDEVTVHSPEDYQGKLDLPLTRGRSIIKVIEASTF